jgi:hypothetical protein
MVMVIRANRHNYSLLISANPSYPTHSDHADSLSKSRCPQQFRHDHAQISGRSAGERSRPD